MIRFSIVKMMSSIRRTIPMMVLIPMLLGIAFTWYLTEHRHQKSIQEMIEQMHHLESEKLNRDLLSQLYRSKEIAVLNGTIIVNAPLYKKEIDWEGLWLNQLGMEPSIHSISYQGIDQDFFFIQREGDLITLTKEFRGDISGEDRSLETVNQEDILEFLGQEDFSSMFRDPKGVFVSSRSDRYFIVKDLQDPSKKPEVEISHQVDRPAIVKAPFEVDALADFLKNESNESWKVFERAGGDIDDDFVSTVQFFKKVKDSQGQTIGALLIQQSLSDLNALTTKSPLWQEVIIFRESRSDQAVDELFVQAISPKTHNYQVASNSFERIPDTTSYAKRFQEEFTKQGLSLEEIEHARLSLSFTEDNQVVKAQITHIAVPFERKWYGVILVHDRAFIGELQNNQKSTLLLFFTGTLLVSWLAIRMSRRIVEPVLGLSNAATEIRKQQFDPRDVGIIAQRQDEFGDLARSFNEMAEVLIAREKDLQQMVEDRTKQIQQQNREIQKKSEENEHLLLNILPKPIAKRLQAGEKVISDSFSASSVLFADLVGFTKLSSAMESSDLVGLLNKIFSGFDDLCLRYGVEKIKTIGDGYLVASGLPSPREDHAKVLVVVGMEMLDYLSKFCEENDLDIQIRIGIHSGPVTAGVIGTHKFIYDLWGDTVNTASRMESTGSSGLVHISEETKVLVSDTFLLEARQPIEVKGKGMMNTFWVKEVFENAVIPQPNHDVRKSVISNYVQEDKISADSSWGEILNSKVTVKSLRALLTKDLFAKREELEGVKQGNNSVSSEELKEMSWGDLLNQNVSLQSLRTLLTKDLNERK